MEQRSVNLGRYEIIRPLAEGGFGQVFLARVLGAAGFKRTVAIKRIRSEHTSSAEFVRDFIKEARIGGFLQHHHVVQVLGFEQLQGNYYLVMEFVDGVGLDQIISLSRRTGVDLPLSVILEICLQAAEGLQYIHTLKDPEGVHLQLVHRDIKPSNLMITRSGLVKITDFGIARAAIEVGMATQAGMIKGTVAYLSPEQARGEGLDHRSDLYALGGIMYEMLALERLYPQESVYALLGELGGNNVAGRLERLPPRASPLLPVLNRLLTATPGERFSDAGELARELRVIQRVVAGGDVSLAGLAESWVEAVNAERGDHTVPGAVDPLANSDFPPSTLVSSGSPEELEDMQTVNTRPSGSAGSLPAKPSRVRPETMPVPDTRVSSGQRKALPTPAPVATPAPVSVPEAARVPASSPASRAPLLLAGGALLLLVAVVGWWLGNGSRGEREEVVAAAGMGLPGKGPQTGPTPSTGTLPGSSPAPGAEPAGASPVPGVALTPPVSGPGNPAEPDPGASTPAVAGQKPGGSAGHAEPPRGSSQAKTGTVNKTGTGRTDLGKKKNPGGQTGTVVAQVETPPPPVVGQKVDVKEAPVQASGAPGKLVVTSSPSAQVYLGERYLGETPAKLPELAPGTYELRLSRPDLDFKQRVSVKVKPGALTHVICKIDGCDVAYR